MFVYELFFYLSLSQGHDLTFSNYNICYRDGRSEILYITVYLTYRIIDFNGRIQKVSHGMLEGCQTLCGYIRVAVFVVDFFTFCSILLDWLFDFFSSSTKRDGKIHRQFFVE